MLKKWVAALAATAALGGSAAMAQVCGGQYSVQRGDTLSQIADVQYKDAGKWTAIHSNNIAIIGKSPDRIQVGQALTLPCIGGLPVGLTQVENVQLTSAAAAAPVPAARAVRTSGPIAGINLLTADDFAPFTDRDLPGGGLFTEIVQKSMETVQPKDNFAIHWVNDWSAHLDPLLSNAMLDLGFPWYQPDCTADPSNWRCANFYFSEPMFEILILLFAKEGEPFVFRSDHDIVGKTLCRPKGYFTHDLDKDGRNWMRDGKIKLLQPVAVADCFEMLMEGEVDAVALNEFTGRTAISEMGLDGQVKVVDRPLSIEGLHVVVAKSHPQAEELLKLVNEGLHGIKDNGAYQQVIDTHMSRIWEEL